MRMEQEVRKGKKRGEEPELKFQAGKVFGPENAHSEDFYPGLDRDSVTYRAQHGEGGTRRRGY